MTRFNRRLTAVVLAALLSSLLLAAADSKPRRVSKKDVPANVVTAVQKAYPEAKIGSCRAEQRDGMTVYVLRVRDGGATRILTYNEGGFFVESREQVGIHDLPVEVTGAFAGRYPRGKFMAAEKLVKGQVVTYRVIILQEKTRYEDLYAPSGTLLSSKP